ncbi:hypothetical protein [Pseudomonas sp. MAG002Y]|uniref:hypothetical protein n=1 Tax=Pseudomonas TaxID=286 RepID=UPI001C609B28|nr:hypothetical protein [Pseudomonas sp. MAG002Y]MBW5416216.1 hypothetical protein [Pseudomonas sp. MAG002Y]
MNKLKRLATLFGVWLLLLVPVQIILDPLGLGAPYPLTYAKAYSPLVFVASKLGYALGSPVTWLIAAILSAAIVQKMADRSVAQKNEPSN